MKLILGTYTKRISQGIYVLELNTKEKMLKNLSLMIEIQNATYLDAHGNQLYAVVQDDKSGLRMYENMRIMNQVTSEEKPPCFVSSAFEKELVMSANYHGGHIDLYSTFGHQLTHRQRITYAAGSHAHSIAYEPRYDEVYVCDLGLDKVLTYRIHEERLILKHTFYTLPNQGPRHFVLHPTLPIVYVLTELSSEVLVLRRHDERFELIQTIETLPFGEDMIKSAAAIRISKDGQFLYASNRGHDSITVFSIQQDATLKTIQNVPTYGKHPRDFNLSPDGQFIVVANMLSDSLTLFERNAETGKITVLQKDFFAPEATCVFFYDEA